MHWVLLLACSTPAPDAAPDAAAPAAVEATPVPAARPTRTGRGPEVEGPPKVASVTLSPERPTAADPITATPVVEGNAGPAPTWSWVWTVDGDEVPGAISATLAPGRAKWGQKVVATATLDGFDPPVQGSSDQVTVANQPPVLLSDPSDLPFVDGMILRAEDPDGTPVTWRVEGGPPGMTIESTKGILHYRGSPDEKGGTYKVKIIAEDRAGDFVAIDLPLTLTPGSAAVRAAEEAKKKEEEEAKKKAAGGG